MFKTILKAFLREYVKFFPIRMNQTWMYVDPRSIELVGGILTKGYAPYHIEILKEYIKNDSVVVDIGAHVGYYTVLAAEQAKSGIVYSFEPDGRIYPILKRNVKSRNLKNVKTYRIAIGNSENQVKLYLSDKTPEDNRLLNPKGEQRIYTIVKQKQLDQIVNKADFIKMDIQGFEDHALRGMTKLIKNSPHLVMLIEFWPDGLRQAKIDPLKMLSRLLNQKFVIYWLDSETKTKKLVKSFPEFLTEAEKHGFVDLLCKRIT